MAHFQPGTRRFGGVRRGDWERAARTQIYPYILLYYLYTPHKTNIVVV